MKIIKNILCSNLWLVPCALLATEIESCVQAAEAIVCTMIDPDSELMWAAENQDLPAVKAALRCGANVQYRGEWGSAALHFAAESSNLRTSTVSG